MADEVRSLDLTGAIAPALSTTSDMPKVTPPKEAPKVGEAQIVKGEEKAGAVEEPPDKTVDKADDKDGEGKGDKGPKPDNTPAWQKAEITKARNRERAADERAKALEDRLDKALTALEKAASRTDTKVETAAADPRPVRSAYDDPEKYESDLVAWSAKAAAKVTQAEIEKAAKEREATETQAKTEREQKETWEKLQSAWSKSRAAGLEKYPDFAEVAESDAVTITPQMAFSIQQENLDDGKGFEIAYHLGKNPEEASKIAALTTQHAVDRAIGRLAERLANKVIPVSKAPTPPKPVGARASATEKSADKESMEEYAARRKAELKKAAPH